MCVHHLQWQHQSSPTVRWDNEAITPAGRFSQLAKKYRPASHASACMGLHSSALSAFLVSLSEIFPLYLETKIGGKLFSVSDYKAYFAAALAGTHPWPGLHIKQQEGKLANKVSPQNCNK